MEASILLWIQDHIRNPILTPIMKAASASGDSGILWIAMILLLFIAAGIIASRNKKTGRTDNPYLKPALVSFFSLLICFLIGHLLLKRTINRTRPYDVIEGLTVLVKKPHDASFPSGHSSVSFNVATSLYLTLPKKFHWFTICCLVLAGLTALSRLYVGVHYPTDVLAGTVLGILCSILVKKSIDKKF